MRRDSIFYKLFQQFPPLLFQLLPSPPPNADAYRFDSVAVKEPKFEIDGVFLPSEADGIVYFCEVQFQKDEQLYERVMVYKFENLSQQEVEAMLDITLQETRVYREIKAKGVKQGRIQGLMQGSKLGRKQEAVNLVVRILTKRFGNLPDEMRVTISGLHLTVIEDLSEALLDFSNLADLQAWLMAR